MIRRYACAVIAVCVSFGFALAEEFNASITKVEDGKVTFQKTKFNKEEKKVEKGDPMTLPAASDVKVTKTTVAFGGGKGKGKGKGKDAAKAEPVDDGLKNEIFTKIGEKGVNATIVTDADGKAITEIRVRIVGGKKGAGGQ